MDQDSLFFMAMAFITPCQLNVLDCKKNHIIHLKHSAISNTLLTGKINYGHTTHATFRSTYLKWSAWSQLAASMMDRTGFTKNVICRAKAAFESLNDWINLTKNKA